MPACLPRAGPEQAAEVVPIPLLWRGARQGGVVARVWNEGRGIQWFNKTFPPEREYLFLKI